MDKAPHPTVGFRLVEARTNPPETFVRHPVRRLSPISGPVSELVAMFNTAMNAHDAHYIETHKFLNTIAIDTLDVAVTDFHRMSKDKKKKEELYESGRKAAQAFLATWNPTQIDTLYPDDRPGPSRRVLTSHAQAVPAEEQLHRVVK
jgi:hypothetical protein